MTSPPGARAHLRSVTARLHEETERVVDLAARTSDLDAYRSLVAGLFGLHEPMEDHLAALPWHEAELDFAPRRKSALLRADLRALGVDADTVPRCTDLPPVDTLAAGFGCLYVLEGSTLGGQLIAREAQQRLGLGPSDGAGFFASYGAGVGRMWRSFVHALDDFVTTPDQLDEATRAAEATFEAFQHWMSTPVAPFLSPLSAPTS